MSPASFVPSRREGVSETEIDGELVLLDTSTGALHVLNRVGAAVWSELDGKRDVEAIIAELSNVAGADVERVRQDVMTFLDELGRGGLLSQEPPEISTSSGEEPGERAADDQRSSGD
jgi:hypothetical protein